MTGAAGPEGRTVLPARPAVVPGRGQVAAGNKDLGHTALEHSAVDERAVHERAVDDSAVDEHRLDRRGGFGNSPDLDDPVDSDQPVEDQFDPEPRDWAWVEEWREGREPMPWGPGLAVACFTGFLVASAVYVLCSGLSNKPLVAIGVNVVVVAGLCPALWLSRGLPVLRWIAGGAAAGVLVAWLSVLVFLA